MQEQLAISGIANFCGAACASTWELFAQVTALFHPGLQDGWVTRSRTPALLWEDFHETTGQTKMASLIQHAWGRWLQQRWLESLLKKLEKMMRPNCRNEESLLAQFGCQKKNFKIKKKTRCTTAFMVQVLASSASPYPNTDIRCQSKKACHKIKSLCWIICPNSLKNESSVSNKVGKYSPEKT